MIFAETPEAKGRIERTFRTIQDRLIPELRLNKIKSVKAANKYLQEEFLGKYWKKHIIKPIESESAYSPLDPWLNLSEILCIEESRVIGRDYTVSWKGQKQIVSAGGMSVAGYYAVFKTDLSGKTKVYVLDREVELKPLTSSVRRLDELPKSEPLEIYPDLWIKMYRQILTVGNAIKRHKITGKPLKITLTG